MNTVICNNISAHADQCCLFVPAGNESQNIAQAVGAATTFNFNLQPYKFTSIKNEQENVLDKKTEFNRFIAFGKSLALQGNGLY